MTVIMVDMVILITVVNMAVVTIMYKALVMHLPVLAFMEADTVMDNGYGYSNHYYGQGVAGQAPYYLPGGGPAQGYRYSKYYYGQGGVAGQAPYYLPGGAPALGYGYSKYYHSQVCVCVCV